jgi:predicted permease
MESLLNDLKFGLKLLWKEKGFSVTALLTLSICIGANTSIFSVINSVLFNPLPFPESDSVVLVYNSYPAANIPRAGAAVPDFYDAREKIEAFEGAAIYQDVRGYTLGESGSPFREMGQQVSPSFFHVLRVEPRIGRLFTEEESESGNNLKVILSSGLWQELYGGDTSAVGEEMRIFGRLYEVVGVMPEDFQFTSDEPRLWIPITIGEEEKTVQNYHANRYAMIARLNPGATVEQATSQYEALDLANMELVPIQLRQIIADTGYHTQVHLLKDDLVREIRPGLWMLWGGVLFVLLIGWVNIANLLLGMANGRIKELSTRYALGAGRSRVARQLLTESILLAVIGGLLGIIFGVWGLSLLSILGAADIPRGSEIALDMTTLVFTLGLAVVAGMIFGTIPLTSILRKDLATIMRSEGRTGTAGRREMLLRGSLVVIQVSLALVLLIGAGLTLVSYRNVISVDPGFEPEGILTGAILPVGERYPDSQSLRLFTDRLLDNVRSLPGVQNAAVLDNLPFGGQGTAFVISADGYETPPGESITAPNRTITSPGYFETMGIPLLQGRVFEDTDIDSSLQVTVIDERLATKFWPDSDPLGKRIYFGVEKVDEAAFTVVGVVGEVKQNDLTDAAPLGAHYETYRQQPLQFMMMVIRTSVEPHSIAGSLRSAVTEIDPDLPVFWVMTMEERIAESLVNRRTPMLLLTIFASIALFLAAIGIYGVLAYAVTQRTREIGIRLALGSSSGRVFNMVIRQGIVLFLIGLPIGIGGGLGISKLIQNQLYEAEAMTPVVFILVSAALAAVAFLACAIPARRATSVDPVSTLHYE